MKNKSTYILITLLLLMIVLIVFFSNSIAEKKKFVKPSFESEAVEGIPDVDAFDEKIVKIKDGYEVYINPLPSIDDGKLLVNFTSIESNDILIKLRIKDNDGNIVGESGILKAGQYVEYVKVKDVSVGDDYFLRAETDEFPGLQRADQAALQSRRRDRGKL